MTKNILEWGWHTSSPNSPSFNSEWKSATTLLGRTNPTTGEAEPDYKVAAWGDRKCQGVCAQGGSRGTTGMYDMERRILCFDCAVKAAGAQDLSPEEKVRILEPFLLQPR